MHFLVQVCTNPDHQVAMASKFLKDGAKQFLFLSTEFLRATLLAL
jgi:hypothetical protein